MIHESYVSWIKKARLKRYKLLWQKLYCFTSNWMDHFSTIVKMQSFMEISAKFWKRQNFWRKNIFFECTIKSFFINGILCIAWQICKCTQVADIWMNNSCKIWLIKLIMQMEHFTRVHFNFQDDILFFTWNGILVQKFRLHQLTFLLVKVVLRSCPSRTFTQYWIEL